MITLPDLTLLRLEKALADVFPDHPVAAILSTVVQPDKLPASLQQAPGVTTLAASELAALASYSLPKRRAQWFTGRLCAKLAIARYLREHLPQLTLPDSRDIVIGNQSTGRPYIETRLVELNGLDLSISHSGDFAAAIVSTAACGIDIQEDSPTLERVRERFCRDDESLLLEKLPDGSITDRLNMVWTAKEAARKATKEDRMPGFLELVLRRPASPEKGYVLWTAGYTEDANHSTLETTILTTRFGQYALSIALVPGGGSHA